MNDKESLKKRILKTSAYCFLTAGITIAGTITCYRMGYDSGKESGIKKGEYLGRLEGIVEGVEHGRKQGFETGMKEGFEIGDKEGFERGKKESKILVESFDFHESETPVARELSQEEYYQKLLEYQLSRKVIRNACNLAAEDYLKEGKIDEAYLVSLLGMKCNAEIGFIEEKFKNRD